MGPFRLFCSDDEEAWSVSVSKLPSRKVPQLTMVLRQSRPMFNLERDLSSNQIVAVAARTWHVHTVHYLLYEP